MTDARLTRLLERLGRGRLPAPQVLVETPRGTLRWGPQERPFHAASVGKVMTATLVGQLVDAGRAGFDTPLGGLLPASDLEGLPAAPGVDPARDITLAHLLGHTSGLPDFFQPRRGRGGGADAASLRVPGRHWSPSALLGTVRGLPAEGRPGQRFRYGDTAYVLLGRVLEESFGSPFNALLRTRIFATTGMTGASTPYSDARDARELSGLDIEPFWIGGRELSRSLGVSLDWAGGGVVAPPGDFLRFQRALHAGRLVSRATLRHMLPPRRRMRPGIHYGLGFATVRFDELAPPLWRGLPEPVGGVGAFATHLFFYPELGAHVVMNFHSSRRMGASFRVHAALARLIARGEGVLSRAG